MLKRKPADVAPLVASPPAAHRPPLTAKRKPADVALHVAAPPAAHRPPLTAKRKAAGVALVVALLVVALATILVAALLDRGELALARTRNGLRAEQAEAYAQGLDAYATQVLMLRSDADTAASPWAQPMPPQMLPDGLVTASMRDLNGCFNLNNLSPDAVARASWQPVFARLLTALGIDARVQTAIEDWLDPAKLTSAEANAYLAQSVPYRPRGGLFAHVSELRLVRGIDGAMYARLAPHVCALPIGTRINVNTASVPVLQALLGPGTTVAVAQALWQNGQAHWTSVQEFWQATPSRGAAPGSDGLVDVNSSAFLARGDIVLDGVPFTVFRLILAPINGRVQVVQRSRGADDALLGAAPIDSAAATR